LVRASGSVAANWIEADEALSKKDFLMRLKICRKEAKESRLLSRLVDAGLSKNDVAARESLGTEARELTLIFLPSSPKADDRLSFFWIWRLSLPWGLGIGIWSFGNARFEDSRQVARLLPRRQIDLGLFDSRLESRALAPPES